MNDHRIVELLEKYEAGSINAEELAQIEMLIEQGRISIEELPGFKHVEEKLAKFEYPGPSLQLDQRFYEMLAAEKVSAKEERTSSRLSLWDWFSFQSTPLRWALGLLTFAAGIFVGYIFFGTSGKQHDNVAQLSEEVRDLKEMVMLSLLEKESATERLQAVSMTEQIDHSSKTVIDALIKTLNGDENVNVRLASLDALRRYTKDEHVREELIKSIALQKSPIIQIALADLMASLQEKSAVTEFDKLLKAEQTPEEAKKRIRKSIEVLI